MYVCFASRQTLRINKLFPIVATGPTLLPSPSIRRRGLLSQTPATSAASVLVMFFLPAPSPFPLSFPISPVMAYNHTDSPLPRVSQIIGTKLEKKESETKKRQKQKKTSRSSIPHRPARCPCTKGGLVVASYRHVQVHINPPTWVSALDRTCLTCASVQTVC